LAGAWPVFKRVTELIAVLPHDRGGRFEANCDAAVLVDEGALCGDPRLTTPGLLISTPSSHL
jgi:hypothetical protein